MTDTDTNSSLRDSASRAYDRTVEGASSAYASTRDGTRDALKRAGDALEANPLAVIVGGAAIGALAGAVLPRTARETQLLGNTGKRLNTAAVAAASAARKVGMEELDAHGISRKAARAQVSRLFDGVVQAASSAGDAAANAASEKGKRAK